MPYGMRFIWTDHDIPGVGDVLLFDDCGEIVALLHRPSFEQDPDGFMDSLERHCDSNVKGYGSALRLAV